MNERFVEDYVTMLQHVKRRGIPFTTCTIYNPRFADSRQQIVCRTGLSILNDVILSESIKVKDERIAK